jgi:hypothetical protein
MTTAAVHASSRSQPSFFGAVPDGKHEDLLDAYLKFLKDRNGELDPDGRFSRREAWLEHASNSAVSHPRPMDQADFESCYTKFDAQRELPPEHLALLAFVKMNASEAYAVEVVGKARRSFLDGPEQAARVERVTMQEESYHTRILVGAAEHFGVNVQGAWRPPFALRVLIRVMAHVPRSFFHSIVLGGEIAGVFSFAWMLRRVGEIFKDQPQLRDALEARLIEVLVDELGHAAYNRLMIGSVGLSVAPKVGGIIMRVATSLMPEMGALGIKDAVRDEFASFDYASLPEEARRRAFFC